ncbi:protein mono-ADP-ribosyltransferase PARP14-like [Cyclopterus lumpus]|uniref:protein mono-ADP-ribosyltransferase PARP14-like n=1 Tax=Cyclopterus lumpus TaxID=8103 RepID=UPI00148621A6|nr:protein mono-ADP-ribosyltransferase PARP14-like [Cyclopterus lumpus]
MDEYAHPLFFEAKHLTDREKGKIRRYFQKKRDSGGGVCGEIETADGDAYKLSFMDKEDQERVLQKKFHDISLPSGEVRLTLSRALAPQTPEQPSCSDAQGASAEPPLQTLAKANTKSYEKIFKLDIFLLYYLRDNPKVNKAVEKQLSCISCTMKLDFDEEEAVVMGCSEKVPGGADKWEMQVDQVFIGICESYICYHVMDPKQAKILQQDQSFMTDDIKVYKESGYVVVVGPAETVNERISLLDNSPPTRKELPIGENQFNLVEEEFSREMRAHYPDVKFLKGLAMLTLEGPDKEVQLGAAKLAELIKKVAKRRLKICTALMNFITSSNVISKYENRFLQSLRHPVSLEAGSDLVLASVSSDALDEAEAAVRRELVVVDVPLQGAAPPDLKEILNTAKNEENSRELRVDVGFIPGPGGTAASEVRLVGYSENVDKLKNVLLDYQTNQAETQVTVSLPHPELLNSFDAFLNLIGFKRTTVTLKTSPSPSRCVLVSGPRGLVQETQEALNSILASLVSDTLVLDGPGAQRYFRAEGRVSKELVETSGGVLIREQQSVQLPIVATQPQSTSSPSGFTSSPSGFTSSPSGFTSSFTSSPSGFTSSPSGFTSSPSGFTSSPSSFTSSPSGFTSSPSGFTSSPSSFTSSPSSFTSSPSSFTSSPSSFTSSPSGFTSSFASSTATLPPKPVHVAVGSTGVNSTRMEIKLGDLADEQANVLVVPMLKGQLNSTKIGYCLLTKTGNAIQANFDSVAANGTVVPGDVLQVAAPPSLGCSKLFFIECSPWDGVGGSSVQVLSCTLRRCLDLCVQQGLTSVAFPIIGSGIVFKYPLREAVQVLTDSICQFGLTGSSGSLSTIHIVIKPDYPDSQECYNEVYRHLSVNMNQDGRAIFKSLTSDLDDLTLTMGGEVKLQLVFGNISNETTDAVVNTTDFLNFKNDGVCKDILTRAGPEVEAELRAANTARGELFVSSPGSFPCSAIFHVCGKKDVVLIEKLMRTIVDQCETSGCKSVAIPAICAGVGGLDPGDVAGAILRGVMAASSSTSLRCLTDVRVVVNKMNVFLGFKEEATKTFPTAVNNGDFHRFVAVSALQSPPGRPQQPPLSERADLSVLCTNSASRQSVFLFLGLSRADVDVAMTKLKDLYHAQCSTKTFSQEELAGLTMDDMKNLKQPMETEGLYVQKSGWGLTVSGLKDGVNKMMQIIHTSLRSTLRREVRVKEEDDLFTRVTWCILGHTGNWESFPKAANHKLENKDVAAGIMDAQSTQWSVDLQRMEATDPLTRQRATLKRLEHRLDFRFPLYWDNMAANQPFTKVALQPRSAEYLNVEELFKQTAQETVMKIERLQDVHQRRAYEVQKNQISDKNTRQGGAGELLLFHGTTEKNCDAIMKNGFNRRYCGQNATVYGEGTYFAVEAKYSAQVCYSKPAADGSQLMFVVRVLTGLYTLGTSGMKMPPPRSSRLSHDLYDSVVDDVGNPSMYVVFHDNQAYPDYLVTFK